MACDSSRFDVIIEKKMPLVLSVGALDMVNFGPKDTIPPNFRQRKIHVHNDQVINLFNLYIYSSLLLTFRLQRKDARENYIILFIYLFVRSFLS